MTNVYLQGLTISVIGMGLTFLALGLLILTMILLQRFFRDEAPPEVTGGQKEVAVSAQAETEEEEIAVAIATALAYWRSVSQSGLGTTLEAEPSPWWVMGRARQYPASALQKIRRN